MRVKAVAVCLQFKDWYMWSSESFKKNFCFLFLKQKKISWKWWHMLALPDTLEAEARGSLILENPDGPGQHEGITPIFLKII